MTAGRAMPGKVKTVTSLANPIVKQIRGLALKKNREEQRLFLAEGYKLVADALESGWPVHQLLYATNMAGESHLQMLAARARAAGADILEVSERVLSAVSRRDNPQMVIGVIGQRVTDAASIDVTNETLWIALDRVRDPGNLGTTIRTADGVGAGGVMLIGETTDPFAPETVRATMGSIFHIPVCRLSLPQFLQWRAGWPGLVVGTHLHGSVDFRQPSFDGRPVLLLMGNEQQGLPEELARSCDLLCRIPMAGAADSLNLAVATGVMAYEIRRHALRLADGG
jgi:RNA methyltransferase, TrmH family